MSRRVRIAATLAAPLWLGAPASALASVENPTYYGDVLPIVQTRCAPCHAEGGIAGLNLHEYETASSFSKTMAGATEVGIMPPFPPETACADYVEAQHRTLTAEQLLTLQNWADMDAPEGDPNDAPDPPEPPPHPYGDPDQQLKTSDPFFFDNQDEDLYWCFRFDPGLDSPRDIISATVTPDNENVVHHVIVFREEDGVDKKPLGLPGFGCGGAPEDGEFLFGWVPGAQPTIFPEGYGMRLDENDALIMQVHYHEYPGALPTDNTSMDLWYADEPVEKNVKVVWTGSYDILVPPGLKQTTDGTCTVPDNAEPVELLAVAPHMHQSGTSFRSWIDRADGSETCLVDIPKWDFDWQGAYSFLQPITVQPGDVVHTECSYRNDTDESIVFGEGTYDEMCFQFNFVVENQKMKQFCFDEPEVVEPKGCGCGVGERGGAGAGTWGLILLLMAARRRRHQPAQRR
jgi:MYXO-CTERM domain-containing protein